MPQMKAIAVLPSLSVLLGTGQGRPKTDQRAVLAQEIRELAYVVPAEFGADALLQLVEMGLTHDPKEKRLLLDDVFRMAGSATFKERWFYTGLHTDTRFGSLGNAYDLRLDSGSQRLRAAELLLPLDSSLARDWFEATVPRRIAFHDCRRVLKYDPSRWYRTLGLIIDKGFSKEERAKGARQLSSPVEVIPAAKWLLSPDLGGEQLARLVAIFSGAVAELPGADRAFDLGLDRFPLGDLIEATSKRLVMPAYGNVIDAIELETHVPVHGGRHFV